MKDNQNWSFIISDSTYLPQESFVRNLLDMKLNEREHFEKVFNSLIPQATKPTT